MTRTRFARTLATVMLAAVVLALSIAAPASAADKSYTMPAVNINATVDEAGTLHVNEERHFDFSGSFSFVYWELDKSPDNAPYTYGEIQVLSMSGPGGEYTLTSPGDKTPGRYTVIDQGDTIRIDAFHSTSDAQATFVLDYEVKGAAKAWDDTGEFYWKFIGDRWDHSVGNVHIGVEFPGSINESDLKVWAHGPLTGVVSKSGSRMNLDVADLPAYTFVEARALFPREALSHATPTPGARLESALAEEADLANTANATRRAAKTQLLLSGIAGAVVPLLALLGAFLLWWKHGRERTSDYPGGYFRELPSDLPPAIVGALWRWGTIGDPETVATLMDLANRSVISVQPTTETKARLFGTKSESTYELTLDSSKWATLEPFEQELLSFLFTTIAHDTTLTISELKAAAKARPETFAKGMTKWKNAVQEDAARRGFFEKTGGTLKYVLIAGAVLLAFFSLVIMGLAEQIWPLPLGLACAGGVAVLGFQMPRRAEAANNLYAKYRGLRDYLRDFSRLDEAPPTHIILWEHFLVMAVVFGIAEKVIEAMRVKVPQVLADPALAHTVWWMSSGPGYVSPASAIAGGFASAASIASSQMSSSSGGGGGFSGGGGGGGGGGGAG